MAVRDCNLFGEAMAVEHFLTYQARFTQLLVTAVILHLQHQALKHWTLDPAKYRRGIATVVTTAGWEQGTPGLSLQEELCRNPIKCNKLGSGVARTAAETADMPECSVSEARSCGRVVCQKPGACCQPLQDTLLSSLWPLHIAGVL